MEIIIMKQSKTVCVCLKNGLVESDSNWRIQDGIIRNSWPTCQTQLWLTTEINWSLGHSQG